MKKRIISILLVITAVFSGGSLATPDTEETVQKSWEEIRQERMIRYDKDVLIETDSEEEIAEKQEDMKQQMEREKEVYLSRQQQAVAEGRELSPPIMPMMAEDSSWNCPYSDIAGGYTLLSPTERLSINVDVGTNIQTIANEAEDKVAGGCSYDSRPQGIFRYYDYDQNIPLQTGYTYVNEPAWSMVNVTGYSLPSNYFEETEPGVYRAWYEGRTKVIFRYEVCEMYVYWDPSINDSVMDYFYYDVYMPMDVFIGDALGDALYDPWKVDDEIQDWFYSNCKDILSGNPLWDSIENYMQVDACDFDFDMQGYYRFEFTSGSGYQNSHGGAKKIPPIIQNINVYEVAIQLSNCNLEGHVPDNMLVGYGGFYELDLSYNRLCGTLPGTSYNQRLNVSNNQFTLIGRNIDTDIMDLEVSNNFILEEEFERYLSADIPCTGVEQQYHLDLIEPERNIELAPGIAVTNESMREYVQVTLDGEPQNWNVASELVFEIRPDESLMNLLSGNAQTGYIAQADGIGSAWLGFTRDKYGTPLYRSDTIGIGNVIVIIGEGGGPGTIFRPVTQGEILQVVVSGKSLQNILTKTFAIAYNANDLELIDAYAPTPLQDLSVGLVPGSNMNITEIIPGSLKFKITPSMGTYTYWGGVATILKFRAKRNIMTTITLE